MNNRNYIFGCMGEGAGGESWSFMVYGWHGCVGKICLIIVKQFT